MFSAGCAPRAEPTPANAPPNAGAAETADKGALPPTEELDSEITDGTPQYSPPVAHRFPNQVYFGDTHLHTSYSADAGMIGNTLGPDDAYRFAKGERVRASQGVVAQLRRPLDFMVVADHSENLGLAPAAVEALPALLENPWGKEVSDLVRKGDIDSVTKAYEMWQVKLNALDDPLAEQTELKRSMWESLTEAADTHNDPGTFTAFIGYEWTSQPDGANMHRNVVYRGDSDEANQVIPFSTYDSMDPEALWAWMDEYESKTGGRVLAIPHGGNLSNGLMFDDITTISKKPLDADYATRRMRWEPLYEVTQIKGDAEAHPSLSTRDELADFETWDRGSFGPKPKTPDMLPKEYARPAYKRGLAYEQALGVNPFKFGLVGSTDAHTSLATTDEDNFFGKVTILEPSNDPIRFEEVIAGRPAPPGSQMYARETSASGLAAVWAAENTREALWDAMARKETYATTGTRMTVRVFGGWDFSPNDLYRSDLAEHGYGSGVPMGGDLTKAKTGTKPRFLITAARDPDGANLDRVQVIKGWIDAKGTPRERIYDVAVSDGRTIASNGRAPKPVGNTVDLETATYRNSIGAPELAAYWEDPDFSPDERAFYYVRVLEIPTPRWTTFDAKFFGVDRPDDVPGSIQERAYTSPIWYTP
jgi:hypothetical protein